MRQLLFLILSLAIACKAKQITDTLTEEKPKMDLQHSHGMPIKSQTRQINQKTEGIPSTFVLKDKHTVNINFGNVDKSKNKPKLKSDSLIKTNEKLQGDLDRGIPKIEVPPIPFLRYLWVFVLLALGLIWFFAPRIKNSFKPTFL